MLLGSKYIPDHFICLQLCVLPLTSLLLIIKLSVHLPHDRRKTVLYVSVEDCGFEHVRCDLVHFALCWVTELK